MYVIYGLIETIQTQTDKALPLIQQTEADMCLMTHVMDTILDLDKL